MKRGQHKNMEKPYDDRGVSSIGTLSDDDINLLCSKKVLISDSFCQKNVQQCCYELRASKIYYDLSNDKTKYDLDELGFSYILIKPKQTVVVVTEEKLNLPEDIVGRILTKGKLFSIGLLPVNTYADPGFTGNLGIVLFNSSNKYIKIKRGEPICKIEFSRLQKPVRQGYEGQHGYNTNIWPIPEDMYLSEQEIATDTRINDISEEIILTYGNDLGKVIKRINKFEKRLIVIAILNTLIAAILIYALLMGNFTKSATIIWAIFLGVAANIITSFTQYLSIDFRRSK